MAGGMRSIVFDAAAEYYDRTRALDPDTHEAIIEIRRHFFAQTGVGDRDRPGLTDLAELDTLMAGRGLAARSLPPVTRRSRRTLDEIIARLEDGIYASCWTLGDAERRAAAGATRAWAVERYGPLGGSHAVETTITWRAYGVA